MSRITDAMLAEYSEDNHEPDNRPVLITPGIYMGHLVDWNKSFNPMFRKYLLVMNFRIDNELIPAWFNIEASESETTVRAGWKSNFLRMYQESLKVRLDRRDRISLSPFKQRPLMLEVITIERDSDQNQMAEVNHYSRVKKILKVIDEDLSS